MLHTDGFQEDVLCEVADELQRARNMHGAYHSAHEAYAVILEELDEFWEQVRLKNDKRSKLAMRKELIQVATTAIRAICDLRLGQ